MLKHIKRLLGIGQETVAESAPYKVETPVETPVGEAALPFPAPKPTKKSAKAPAAKASKPKAPRKPKAPKA
jgi:hypothetical protein